MPTWAWIIVALLAAAVVAGIVYAGMQRRRSRRLRTSFGPEYERALADRGDRRDAERELEGRARRRQSFDIRPLAEADREQYATQWRGVQSRFVDAPNDALGEADSLVSSVMRVRGYPVADFDQRAADLSVDHPVLVANYRYAHGIAARRGGGQVTTEELRQAMIHYRALFDELLAAVAEQAEPSQRTAVRQ
jgi:hypothetical protein